MEHPNHAKNLDKLIALRDSGISVPSLDKMPSVDPIAKPYWEAWNVLSPRRDVSELGPRPIKVSEILAYCELNRIDDPDEKEDLYQVILLLDELYVAAKTK